MSGFFWGAAAAAGDSYPIFETAPSGVGTLASPVAGDIGMLGYNGPFERVVAETVLCDQDGIRVNFFENQRIEFDLNSGHTGKKFKFTRAYQGDPNSNWWFKVYLNATEIDSIDDMDARAEQTVHFEFTIPAGAALYAIEAHRADEIIRCFRIDN